MVDRSPSATPDRPDELIDRDPDAEPPAPDPGAYVGRLPEEGAAAIPGGVPDEGVRVSANEVLRAGPGELGDEDEPGGPA